MNHNDDNDRYDAEFNQMTSGFTPEPAAGPYGDTRTQPHKPGLTKRGRIGLAVAAAVVGGGSLIGYQVHSSNEAAAEAKAQEIQLQADRLELEKLREMNRASEVNRKVETTAEQARQNDIDACVKANSDKIGKGLGSPTRRDVVDDCQAQYTGTTDGDDMAAAGTSTDTGNGGLDVSSGMLIGVAALGLVAFAATRGRRRNDYYA